MLIIDENENNSNNIQHSCGKDIFPVLGNTTMNNTLLGWGKTFIAWSRKVSFPNHILQSSKMCSPSFSSPQHDHYSPTFLHPPQPFPSLRSFGPNCCRRIVFFLFFTWKSPKKLEKTISFLLDIIVDHVYFCI